MSAGGLLVGATVNRSPDLFRAALASVPFLDAAGTLQDSSLPLTANEWEEFGNPNEASGHAEVMAFSPVHNVRQGVRYPACLLLPALNDARTGFWEAHKYAHAIRTNGYAPSMGGSTEADGEVGDLPSDGPARPVLVATDMEGGHFRSAVPAERAAQRAKELAFLVAFCRRDDGE